MQNSKAYDCLIKQLNANGSEKMDGYYPKVMEEIYDWEREEVEDIIWDAFFNKNEIELAQKLGAIEEFTIDRIEDNIAVLENRETKEIVNVDISKLPQNINEGEILNKINGKYILDKDKTEEVSNRIKNKMNNLWE